MQEFEQLAFHDERELLNDRRVDAVALYGVIAGALEFVGDLVAGGDAEEVGDVHMRLVREGDGEGAAGLDVEPGPLALADKEDDLVVVADLPPGDVHHVDFSVFVVGGDHQHRHRIDGLQRSQIFFHVEFSFAQKISLLSLPIIIPVFPPKSTPGPRTAPAKT